MSGESPKPLLKPLNIKCTSADCTNNLHCFLKTKRLAAAGKTGHCRYCDADLVNWNRVHRRDLSDVAYTFEALRLEMIRHYFWHTPLSERAKNHARRKGKEALREFATKQLRRLVGSPRHAREGYQTPRETNKQANVIHFAQHATACCCRKCIAEWHAIPEGRPLSKQELSYFTELVLRYACERIPELTDIGVSIPPIRKRQIETQTATRHSPPTHAN
jgi:hypothetical protein